MTSNRSVEGLRTAGSRWRAWSSRWAAALAVLLAACSHTPAPSVWRLDESELNAALASRLAGLQPADDGAVVRIGGLRVRIAGERLRADFDAGLDDPAREASQPARWRLHAGLRWEPAGCALRLWQVAFERAVPDAASDPIARQRELRLGARLASRLEGLPLWVLAPAQRAEGCAAVRLRFQAGALELVGLPSPV